MKHTPGPWDTESHTDDLSGYYSIEALMIGRSGVIADTANRDHVIDPEEDRANARLIAAAPDLLAACQAFVKMFGQQRTLYPCEQMAIDAIAKATCKSPERAK